MNIVPVKVDRNNRVKIQCSCCDIVEWEVEMYADLDTPFKYVCKTCLPLAGEV
jgi:hypothetical protein